MERQQMKQILARLPSLTQQELATVRAACDHLLTSPLEAPNLYQVMLGALSQKGPSYASFQRTIAWKSWQQHLPTVQEFTEKLWPGVSKTQETSLNKFLLWLLIDDLKALTVPVTVGSICSNLGRVPEVFDRSFPGYREGGLAGKILAAMVNR